MSGAIQECLARIIEVVDQNGRLHITEQHLKELNLEYGSEIEAAFNILCAEKNWTWIKGTEDEGWLRAGDVISKAGETGFLFLAQRDTYMGEAGFSYEHGVIGGNNE